MKHDRRWKTMAGEGIKRLRGLSVDCSLWVFIVASKKGKKCFNIHSWRSTILVIVFFFFTLISSPGLPWEAKTDWIHSKPLDSFTRLFIPFSLPDTSLIEVQFFLKPNGRPSILVQICLVLWMKRAKNLTLFVCNVSVVDRDVMQTEVNQLICIMYLAGF